MISQRKAREILQYLEEHGKTATLEKYDILEESLKRYMRELRYDKTKNPKVLLLDIETTLMEVRTFNLFNKQPISYKMIARPSVMLSWAAKWLYSTEIMGEIMTSEEAVKDDDERIVRQLWTLLYESNVVIGHNIDKFDKRVINSRFMHYQLPPPSAYRTIDTYKASKTSFREASNRLDYLVRSLVGDSKIETDWELWVKCGQGDKESLEKMLEYNKNDVKILEEYYLWIRPWIKNHPNIGLLSESSVPVCRYCGSHKIHEEGEYITPLNRYPVYRCEECGGIFAYPKSNISPFEKGNYFKNAPI